MGSFAWIPFFLAPFLVADIFLNILGNDLLALATGLFAAAWMWQPGKAAHYDTVHKTAWLFLMLCMIPLLILLLDNGLRSPWFAWRGMLYLAAAWLVFRMSRGQAARLMESRAFTYLLATVAFLYVVYAFIQAYDVRFPLGNGLFPIWWYHQVNRFTGPLRQPNEESIFMAITAIAILFHATHQKQPTAWENLLAILPCTGMLLTASRSGLLCFILGGILLCWTATDRKQCLRLIATGIIPALAISIFVQNTLPHEIGAPVTMANRIETGGFLERLFVWDICWQLFRQHPLLGIGWGNMPAYSMDGAIAAYQAHPWAAQVPIASGGNMWAHNLVFQFFMEGGLPGGAAILILLWATCVKLLRMVWHALPTRPGVMLGGILSVMLFAHGMLSISMMQPFFQVLLALFLAALFPTGEEANA